MAQHRVFFDGKVTQNSVIIAIYKKNIRKSLSITAQRFFVEKDLIREFVEVVAVLLTGERGAVFVDTFQFAVAHDLGVGVVAF